MSPQNLKKITNYLLESKGNTKAFSYSFNQLEQVMTSPFRTCTTREYLPNVTHFFPVIKKDLKCSGELGECFGTHRNSVLSGMPFVPCTLL